MSLNYCWTSQQIQKPSHISGLDNSQHTYLARAINETEMLHLYQSWMWNAEGACVEQLSQL